VLHVKTQQAGAAQQAGRNVEQEVEDLEKHGPGRVVG
jgi:hypothetical protein